MADSCISQHYWIYAEYMNLLNNRFIRINGWKLPYYALCEKLLKLDIFRRKQTYTLKIIERVTAA